MWNMLNSGGVRIKRFHQASEEMHTSPPTLLFPVKSDTEFKRGAAAPLCRFRLLGRVQAVPTKLPPLHSVVKRHLVFLPSIQDLHIFMTKLKTRRSGCTSVVQNRLPVTVVEIGAPASNDRLTRPEAVLLSSSFSASTYSDEAK